MPLDNTAHLSDMKFSTENLKQNYIFTNTFVKNKYLKYFDIPLWKKTWPFFKLIYIPFTQECMPMLR